MLEYAQKFQDALKMSQVIGLTLMIRHPSLEDWKNAKTFIKFLKKIYDVIVEV